MARRHAWGSTGWTVDLRPTFAIPPWGSRRLGSLGTRYMSGPPATSSCTASPFPGDTNEVPRTSKLPLYNSWGSSSGGINGAWPFLNKTEITKTCQNTHKKGFKLKLWVSGDPEQLMHHASPLPGRSRLMRISPPPAPRGSSIAESRYVTVSHRPPLPGFRPSPDSNPIPAVWESQAGRLNLGRGGDGRQGPRSQAPTP